MSLRIEIIVADDALEDAGIVDRHMRHIGFERAGPSTSEIANIARFAYEVGAAEAVETPAASPTRVVESEEQTAARRERGKPAPGRARRTKEEIAEDEAADKRDAEQTSEPTQQAISTGENRVGPEDDPETQAQDKADETTEADAKREEAAPLTIMDGKAALGDYINKFSMAAAQEDGPKIFVSVLGPVPDGAAGWTWPLALEKHGQSGLDNVIGAWRAAAAAEKRFGA
jgi:hypothetical protein